MLSIHHRRPEAVIDGGRSNNGDLSQCGTDASHHCCGFPLVGPK